MVIIGPLVGSGQAVADWLGAGDQFAVLWDWARWPVIVVVLVLWAVTLFHLAPNHRTPWRADVPGALVTATLWALLSLGLRAFLALAPGANQVRSEEHTSGLQSLMRITYAVFCLNKKINTMTHIFTTQQYQT